MQRQFTQLLLSSEIHWFYDFSEFSNFHQFCRSTSSWLNEGKKWGSRCPRSRKLEVFQSKNSDIAVRARHRAQKLALYLYNTQKNFEVIHRSRKDFTAPQSWQATFHKISCENPSKFNKNLKIHTVLPWISADFDEFSRDFLWNFACQLWRAVKNFWLLWYLWFFFLSII